MTSLHDTQEVNMPTGTSAPSRQEASGADDMHQSVGAQLRDKVQETRAQVRDKAQELGDQAKEKVSEYYEEGRESLAALNRTVEAQIRERPLQSLLVAGGIGLLLGCLWRRS